MNAISAPEADGAEFAYEQAVLGGILQDPRILPRIMPIVTADDMLDPLHGRVYSAMLDLHNAGKPISVFTLKPLFETDPARENAGRDIIGYLAELSAEPMATIVRGQPEVYAEAVADLAAKRQAEAALAECQDAINAAPSYYEMTAEKGAPRTHGEYVQAKLSKARLSLANAEARMGGTGTLDRTAAINSLMATIEAAYKSGSAVSGIATGIGRLDAMLGGLRPGEVTILAGRPSMGKTALGVTIAWNIAKAGIPVMFFSLEMSTEQLYMRVISAETGISTHRQRTGQIEDSEWSALNDARQALQTHPLWIDQDPRVTPASLVGRVRKRIKPEQQGLAVIDYLQLMNPDRRARESNRVAEVSEISREIKLAAKELDMPIIVLSQLSRAVEAREDKRPQLSDLRESGAIEQDADIVAFLYRDEYYLAKSEPKRRTTETDQQFSERIMRWTEALDRARGQADVLIEKQRFGPTGRVDLRFDAERQQFRDY